MSLFTNLAKILENKYCEIYDEAPRVKLTKGKLVIECCCLSSTKDCLTTVHNCLENEDDLYVVDNIKENTIVVGSLSRALLDYPM
ncbi:MAG: hypothetical protein ACTHJ8_10350 [Mucilaginibacter sp.]|jgi:hypothetical protein